jgi:hypothetical protein
LIGQLESLGNMPLRNVAEMKTLLAVLLLALLPALRAADLPAPPCLDSLDAVRNRVRIGAALTANIEEEKL